MIGKLAVVTVLVALVAGIAKKLDIGKELEFTKKVDCKVVGAKEGILGGEDLAIWRDGVVLTSSGDLHSTFKHGAGKAKPGGIYAVDPAKGTATRLPIEGGNLKRFQPHGIHFSNATERLYAVSHTDEEKGSVVEVFDVLTGPLRLRHRRTISASWPNHGPNDVVEGGANEIYVTQWLPFGHPVGGEEAPDRTFMDKAKKAVYVPLNLMGVKMTRVWRCVLPDNVSEESKCAVEEDAGWFVMANGITATPDKSTIFVADCTGRKVVALARGADGHLIWASEFPVMHSPDNIEFDHATGTLQMGTIPLIHKAVARIDDPTVAVPGSLLQVSLLGTGGSSYAIGTEKDILMHDGSMLSQVSAGVRYGAYSVVGSPYSPGVLVCKHL